ncbi:MarR family winged helix-turn-helix transcriptional regulator [Novosphingopyxis sp. YJ-S2-01]|uniref:MarR family winged helix-turn-helix transcriptional regulator n=1 Tax=Novosphingopyxis sp. YJ-S2-01 TaxID=2794021 RepID=UPI0018DCF543|nr:MarR family transcriptional regulator [Novosphingopyxis sp. YJ-S2-01]MBH9536770.1 MarR family transcriptional regulator [Novosphingopyxis sp. YJ-S2-01]
MQFSRATSAGYLINDLARRFAAALQTRIKPLGLSTGVFPIMVQLWEEDGLTQADLVRRIGIEQATMANTLMRMQRDGLIDRRPSQADGRAQEVRLTEKGRKLQVPAIEAALAVNASALAGLSSDERSQFLNLLSKTIDTFDAAAETARS